MIKYCICSGCKIGTAPLFRGHSSLPFLAQQTGFDTRLGHCPSSFNAVSLHLQRLRESVASDKSNRLLRKQTVSSTYCECQQYTLLLKLPSLTFDSRLAHFPRGTVPATLHLAKKRSWKPVIRLVTCKHVTNTDKLLPVPSNSFSGGLKSCTGFLSLQSSG